MAREAAETGILGIVAQALRASRGATALVVAAALVWALALGLANDPSVGMAVPPGGPAEDVDARVVSALLEIRNGAWAVRADDVVVEPTLGRGTIDVAHASASGHLAPWDDLWAAGGPLLRRRVPDWSIQARYRVFREPDGTPAISANDVTVWAGGWRGPPRWSRVELGTATIATGFNPHGPTAGYPAGEGDVLHLVGLLPADGGDPRDAQTWRAGAAEAVARLAGEARRSREPEALEAWWRQRDTDVLAQAALAAVLRVPEALADLLDLRSSRERVTGTLPDQWRFRDGGRAELDACCALLGTGGEEEIGPAQIDALAAHFVVPLRARDRLGAVYADVPSVARAVEEMRRPTSAYHRSLQAWSPPLGPGTIDPLFPGWMLLVVAAAAWGGDRRVRGRDALAFLVAAAVAALFVDVVPHLTVQSVGLMALALVTARLGRRGAIRVAPGVPHGFAVAALALPLADLARLPLLDAIGRAAAFVALAWLALAPLDPPEGTGDAPRRAPHRRQLAWTSVQILAVAGCVLALLLALLDPLSWPQRPPRPRWVLVAAGLVLATFGGLVAYARAAPPRPLPAAVCATAIGASAHLTVLALSPLPTAWLSGEEVVGAAGTLAAAALAVLVAGRLLAGARTGRRRPEEVRAAAPAADHRPR